VVRWSEALIRSGKGEAAIQSPEPAIIPDRTLTASKWTFELKRPKRVFFDIIKTMNEVRIAKNSELSELPSIEKSADFLFEEAGIRNLPPAAGVEELRSSKCILVIGNPPKGFIRVDEVGNNAHIEQLSVGRNCMGEGLGGKLLEAGVDWAKEKGYSQITLITFKNIPWNGPFYKKHGFDELSSITDSLKKLREHEKEIGLDSIGERTVMYKKLN
jgi:GNAT superfamily N-acetyltransferase